MTVEPRTTSGAGLRIASPVGRGALAATVLGTSLAWLDGSVVNVALPHIASSLKAHLTGEQWMVNAYTLALASLLLLGGSLADRLGRRKTFLVGVAGFALASLLCAVAPNLALFLTARVLQGIFGALLTPSSLALLEASFAREDRATAVGLWSAFGAVAGALGPTIGGLVVAGPGWRWIFLLQLPFAAGAVLLGLRFLPAAPPPKPEGSLDVRGALLAASGFGLLTYGLTEQEVFPAVGGGLLLVGFGLSQRRAHALVPLAMFADRTFSTLNGSTLTLYGALGALFFLVPLRLQTVFHYSPVQAGLTLLPMTIALAVLSRAAGRFATTHGPRGQLLLGPLLVAAGCLLLTQLNGDYVTRVLPGVLLLAVGMGSVVAPLTATVLAAADDRYAGSASAVNTAVARAAGLLAVAVLPGLGYQAGIVGCAVLAGSAVLLNALGLPRSKRVL